MESYFSNKIAAIAFLVFFWPFLFSIRLLTGGLVLCKGKDWLRLWHRMSRRSRRVVYLDPFFPENAGFEYRTQKWIDFLNAKGFVACARYVFGREAFDRLWNRRTLVRFYVLFMLRRMWQCCWALNCGCVVVRRELLLYNDYGGLFLDRFLLAAHPNVILDFDDDIRLAKREPRAVSTYGRLMLESGTKFGDSLRLYPAFIAGSTHLRELVLAHNPAVSERDVLVIPTCVDYYRHAPKNYGDERACVTFGWIGSVGNLMLLDLVLPALNRVARDNAIRLVVISGRDYTPKADFEVVNLPWSLDSQLDDLRRVDVGLMPLSESDEDKGKCGFKLIQYMGLGIVSVASAVTPNTTIIADGQDGFLVWQPDDWEQVLRQVLARQADFAAVGAKAREKIHQHYSFEAYAERYANFLKGRCS